MAGASGLPSRAAVATLSRPEVGVYAVGNAIGHIGLAPFAALVPTLTGQARVRKASVRLLLTTSGAAVLVLAVMAAAYLLAGPSLVAAVYGPAFAGSYGVNAVLLLAALLSGVDGAPGGVGGRGRRARPLRAAPGPGRGGHGGAGPARPHDARTAGARLPLRQRRGAGVHHLESHLPSPGR